MSAIAPPRPSTRSAEPARPDTARAEPARVELEIAGLAVSRRRPRGRVQWFVLAGALVVLAGTLVAWALQRAGHRTPIVVAAHHVSAGSRLTADDLALADVAVEPGVRGLVPGADLHALIGRVAALDLQAGEPVVQGAALPEPTLHTGEVGVAVALRAGRSPAGMSTGDRVLVVELGGDGRTWPARVLAIRQATTEWHVTLAMDTAAVTAVTDLVAKDAIAVAAVPVGAGP